VIAGALRLLNIAPDALPETTEQIIAAARHVEGQP
jgi:hypothetical protein